jgi:hypothetical protein
MTSAGILYVVYMIMLVFTLIGFVASAILGGVAGGLTPVLVASAMFAPSILFLGWVVFTLRGCVACLETAGIMSKK